MQSVTGGVVLPNDNETVSTMLTYAGGQSGYGTMGISPGCTVGAAAIRRDGFAAMVADATGGSLRTRPLTWAANKTTMFVNCDGGLSVELLQVGSSKVLLRSAPMAVNSTRVEVVWAAASIETATTSTFGAAQTLPAATAAAPLQVRFTLEPGARLYSFWVSANRCGASGGVVAGGGPGFDASRDLHGSCHGR